MAKNRNMANIRPRLATFLAEERSSRQAPPDLQLFIKNPLISDAPIKSCQVLLDENRYKKVVRRLGAKMDASSE